MRGGTTTHDRPRKPIRYLVATAGGSGAATLNPIAAHAVAGSLFIGRLVPPGGGHAATLSRMN